MNERRSLVDGLKQTPPTLDPKIEKDFVFQSKSRPSEEIGTKSVASPTTTTAPALARAPISTRIRGDLADALKRASLERQLSKTEPSTLQEILEQAIEPWLKANGYLP